MFGEECLEGSRFVIIDGVPVMIDDDDDDDAGTETTATTAETTETDTTEDSEETTTANETEDGESEGKESNHFILANCTWGPYTTGLHCMLH